MLTRAQKSLLEKLQGTFNLQKSLGESLKASGSVLEATEKALSSLRAERASMDRLIKEKTLGFSWLADAIAQYHEMCDLKVAELLEKKLRPAIRAAARIREIASERRAFHQRFRIARNRVLYYEKLFPHIRAYVADGIDDLVRQVPDAADIDQPVSDPVLRYLPPAEYNQLSEVDRNQKALNCWRCRPKRPWEVGRDYERFIGYQLEQRGFSVVYHGATEGLADMGRDLIATDGPITQIIQCKRWRAERPIREKHIFQLFGTTVEWVLKNRTVEPSKQWELFPETLLKQRVKPVFFTSSVLSDEAARFANILGIETHQNYNYDNNYPVIKCNRSHRTGGKIYHLPFDQQYDLTTIDKERNEQYTSIVAEAVALGYRRAWRWRGQKT